MSVLAWLHFGSSPLRMTLALAEPPPPIPHVPERLRKCAGWYFRVHALVLSSHESTVYIACPRPLGNRIFRWCELGSGAIPSPSGHKCCCCPLGIPSAPAQVCRALTTTTSDVGHATQGPGVPDHRVLSISGTQHFQAFYHRACRVFTSGGGGGGVNRAPQNGGGGVREKGSIDRHH